MKALWTIAVCLALASAGCMPCRQNADCGDGQVCSAGTCQAVAACSAGQTAPCVCAGGAPGMQVCNAGGSAFGACGCADSCGPAGCATMPDLVNKEVGEAGQLLKDANLKLPDPSDPTAYIVERRFNDPPSVVLEQFPAAGGKLPRGTAPLLRVVMPPDQETLGLPNSSFLVGQLAQHDEVAAQAYYDAVDPGPVPSRGTLKDWKIANGFGDPTQGIAPEPADDEAATIYSNRADLGFGRHMHMRRKGDHIAFYVDNYPTLEDMANDTRKFATVAMEWTRPAGNPSGRPFTKFFTFNKKGERIYDPALDSHGIKLQPGVCLACHGGTISDAQFSNGGDLGAHFIPFDLDTLGFSTRPGYTRADQELQFKKLNVAVKMTYPADDPAYPSGDPAPVPELVDGWYGGPGMPSPFFDGKFVPAAWGVDQTAWDIYLDVFAKTCRGCHMQREVSRNFSTYAKFWSRQGLIYQRVFEDGAMPLSEKGNLNFWLSSPSEPKILAAWLGKPFQAPGKPVARVRVANNGLIRPGDTVTLDGRESQYAEKLTWTQTSGPAVTLSIQGTTASFVAPSPAATVDIQLVASFATQQAAAIAHVVTVDPPGAPGTPTATAGVQSATVFWTAPGNTGNSPIGSYTVTALVQPAGTAVATATTPNGTTTNATVTGLTAGAQYRFRVTATNQAGLTSLPSSIGPPTAVTALAPPAGAVTSFVLIPGPTNIEARWNAPATGNIDSYRIQVYRNGAGNGTLVADVPNHTVGSCGFPSPSCRRTFTNLRTCDYNATTGTIADCLQQYTVHIWAHDPLAGDTGTTTGFFSPGTGYGARSALSAKPLVSYAAGGDNIVGIWTAPSMGCTGCHSSTAHFPGLGAPVSAERAYCDASRGTCSNPLDPANQCGTCNNNGSLSNRQRIYLCPSNTGACAGGTIGMGVYFNPGDPVYDALFAWVADGNQR